MASCQELQFHALSRVGLEPGTHYQATRKVLLNEMLKPFAIPPFNIFQQPFYSIQQNRTDVEPNVEAVCAGRKGPRKQLQHLNYKLKVFHRVNEQFLPNRTGDIIFFTAVA